MDTEGLIDRACRCRRDYRARTPLKPTGRNARLDRPPPTADVGPVGFRMVGWRVRTYILRGWV